MDGHQIDVLGKRVEARTHGVLTLDPPRHGGRQLLGPGDASEAGGQLRALPGGNDRHDPIDRRRACEDLQRPDDEWPTGEGDEGLRGRVPQPLPPPGAEDQGGDAHAGSIAEPWAGAERLLPCARPAFIGRVPCDP